jgi:hypothetical protein
MKRLIHPKYLVFLILAAASFTACAPKRDTPAPTQAPLLPQDAPLLGPTDTSVPQNTTVTSELQPAPVVTPRGPDLVATDPATVNLASGQLQLVEFFRFT